MARERWARVQPQAAGIHGELPDRVVPWPRQGAGDAFKSGMRSYVGRCDSDTWPVGGQGGRAGPWGQEALGKGWAWRVVGWGLQEQRPGQV